MKKILSIMLALFMLAAAGCAAPAQEAPAPVDSAAPAPTEEPAPAPAASGEVREFYVEYKG